MIDKKFLEELGLSEEIISKIQERLEEGEKKDNFEKLLREEIEKLNPHNTELILELFDVEELEDADVLKEKLEEFRAEYPFLFKQGDMPQLAGSTKSAKGITAEEFNNMGYKKRTELYKKNPKLYKQLANA